MWPGFGAHRCHSPSGPSSALTGIQHQWTRVLKPGSRRLVSNSPPQQTLAGETELTGVGVHSGRPARVRLLPAEADAWVRFRRVDLPGTPEIPASLDYVLADQLSRRTTLGLDAQVCVATVEHLLAACLGLGLDNALIEVDSDEMPIFDGSAEPIARAILECGLVELDRPRRYFELSRPVIYDQYPVQMIALPLPTLRMTYFVEFDNAVIPFQTGHFQITPETFRRDLAPARTFCFLRDVKRLQAEGLIQGGNLDCAIVIAEDRILNEPLRFPDEMIRHKVIDLLGDLCLLGRPLRGHISAWRAGHASHIEFLKKAKEALSP
jgi:UDP-3-O-acyl N-acetylglucosamine deacetylase